MNELILIPNDDHLFFAVYPLQGCEGFSLSQLQCSPLHCTAKLPNARLLLREKKV